jgi:hypothetical protein
MSRFLAHQIQVLVILRLWEFDSPDLSDETPRRRQWSVLE